MSDFESKFDSCRSVPGRAGATLKQLQQRWGFRLIGSQEDPIEVHIKSMGKPETWVRIAKGKYELLQS